MIDTESLKKTIIDKATAGLLSSHFSGDGDVNEIISKLPSVSNKRKKLLEQSFDYGKEYDIPSHWKWVRLGEISSYGDTPTKVMPSHMKEGMWILELEDIESGGKLLTKKRYPDRKPAGEKTAFNKGQILYSKLRPYLKKVLIADEDGISTPELIAFDVFADINAKYISYYLVNSYVDKVINQRSYGVKMPRVDVGFMANLPVPLPPLEEQERIVALVEQAMIEIGTIATLQQQYEADLSVLKGKIIDAGIRGKLTEQLSEDGDAETLFSQIQEEKAKLIKEGKIKKEKPLPKIDVDEIPFEIPKNWKWVRFGDLYSLTNGIASRGSIGGTLRPVLRLADLVGGEINTKNVREIKLTDTEFESHKINSGNIIFIRVNGSRDKVANAFLYCGDNEVSYCDHLFSGRKIYDEVDSSYIMFVYRSDMAKKQVDPEIKTTAGQNTINQNGMGKILIPLPPISEQKRIAKKIAELHEVIS